MTAHHLPVTAAPRPVEPPSDTELSAIERAMKRAKFVNFNVATLADVPAYSDANLLRLTEWTTHNITTLKNREALGGWDAIRLWYGRISELRELGRAAETELRARRVLK